MTGWSWSAWHAKCSPSTRATPRRCATWNGSAFPSRGPRRASGGLHARRYSKTAGIKPAARLLGKPRARMMRGRGEPRMSTERANRRRGASPNGQGRPADGVDHARIEAAVREILFAVGEDPDREGLQETP